MSLAPLYAAALLAFAAHLAWSHFGLILAYTVFTLPVSVPPKSSLQ